MPDFHGYGVYIWSAYGAAFFILVTLVVASVLNNRRLKKLERNFEA